MEAAQMAAGRGVKVFKVGFGTKEGAIIGFEDRRCLAAPANFGQINFSGTFRFAIDKYAEAVLRGAEPRRRGAAI